MDSYDPIRAKIEQISKARGMTYEETVHYLMSIYYSTERFTSQGYGIGVLIENEKMNAETLACINRVYQAFSCC